MRFLRSIDSNRDYSGSGIRGSLPDYSGLDRLESRLESIEFGIRLHLRPLFVSLGTKPIGEQK